jgi:hypothetical protein
MQTSGLCPQLSDGVKKTITTKPPKAAPVAKLPKPEPSPHRRGGFAKHAKGGK